MNRQQALEWLVENVTKWPVDIEERHTYGELDFFESTSGDVVFSSISGWEMYPDEKGTASFVITQQDWLDATDNMKEKRDE